MILHDAQTFAKALQMHDLSLPQEADWLTHIGIVRETQNIVIRCPGLLFCSKVFAQVGDGIAAGLEERGSERCAAGCLWPHAEGMIHIVSFKSAGADLFRCQISCQLADDRADDLNVCQLFRTHMITVICEALHPAQMVGCTTYSALQTRDQCRIGCSCFW